MAVLGISASSESALAAFAAAVEEVDADPRALAAALARRAPKRVRAAAVVPVSGAPLRLDRAPLAAGAPTVAFVVSGQGSQWAGMGLALDAHPASRAALDACAAVLDPLLGRPLRALLADAATVDLTEHTQPLLFATAWATAALLRAHGVAPAVVAGHSLGELVAAALAGVWSLEDALAIVVARGRGMADRALPGAMAAVGAPGVALAPGAELAAWNAPDEVVVAGPADAVEATLAALPPGVRVARLSVSRPFHSACVEPMLDGFEAAVRAVPARSPAIRVVSLATGRLESEALTDPRFWRDHARNPVRCVDAARALADLGVDVVVDLGPSPVLAGLLRRTIPTLRAVATWRRDADPWETLGRALGDLYELGADVDLGALHGPVGRVALPPTPLDRRPTGVPPAAIELPPVYEVVWEPVTERVPVPPVRVLGEGGPPSDASASTTLDLRLRGLEDLPKLADIAGERWIVVLRGEEPVVAALRAAVRSARLERPGTRVELRIVEDDGALGLDVPGDEVRMRGPTALAPRLAPAALPAVGARFEGRWWVTGGTGALGERFASFLLDRGAREVVRIARTPGEGVEALDVADEAAVRALAERLPPDGVIHAAGVTFPQALGALDPETVSRTLRPKVGGARALDAALGAVPLVLVGSIAAVWGSRDLVAYAAANGFLEGLARARSAAGRPTTCLAFGPWGGGGMVDDARAAELARAGLALLPPRGTLEVLGRAVARLGGPADLVVVRADWSRLVPSLEVAGPQPLFRGLVASAPVSGGSAAPHEPLVARIRRHARSVLGLAADRPLPDDRPLAELGFDSLMATELKARLLADGVDLPLGRILSGPSVEELVEMAEARAPREAPAPAPEAPVSAPEEPDRLLWWTHLAALVVGVGIASGIWALLR